MHCSLVTSAAGRSRRTTHDVRTRACTATRTRKRCTQGKPAYLLTMHPTAAAGRYGLCTADSAACLRVRRTYGAQSSANARLPRLHDTTRTSRRPSLARLPHPRRSPTPRVPPVPSASPHPRNEPTYERYDGPSLTSGGAADGGRTAERTGFGRRRRRCRRPTV
jgi:hypothetical protein